MLTSIFGSKEPLNLCRQQSLVISDQVTYNWNTKLYYMPVQYQPLQIIQRGGSRIKSVSPFEASAAFLAYIQMFGNIMTDSPPNGSR